MKSIIALFLAFSFWSCASNGELYFDVNTATAITESTTTTLDHSSWDALLKKHVDNKGNVNYSAFKADQAKLKTYLDYLSDNAPDKSFSRAEQFAYYINLYNAATVYLILDNDIPASIKDISGPFGQVWLKKFFTIGKKKYSLNNVEKGVLLKMNEPRVHFAINCASYSCPKLQNTAFTADNLEQLLDKGAREFVNSDKNVLSDSRNPKLSKIFDWYKSDFTDTGKSLIEYINQYTTEKIATDATIGYVDYDWSLNKQ